MKISVVGLSSAFHDFEFEGSVSNKKTLAQAVPYTRTLCLIHLVV